MKQTDYENHPVHGNLREILNKLDEDGSGDIDVRELKAILDYMSWMLSQSDVALLKKDDLDGANHVCNQIAGYKNGSMGPSAALQTILPLLTTFYTKLPYPRVRKIFRSEANEQLELLRQEAEALREKFANETQELQKQSVQFAKTANEKQNANTDRLDMLKEQLAELKGSFDALLEAEKVRWNSEVSAIYEKKKAELAEDTKNKVAELEELIDKFDTKNKELDQLLEASGNTALAGGLSAAADKEFKEYKLFRRFSVGTFGLSALLLIYIFNQYVTTTDTFRILDFIQRLPLSVIFALPALYFSSVARSHQNAEQRYRSLSLRVASFATYVKSIDGTIAEDEIRLKTELYKELASEFFKEPKEPESIKIGRRDFTDVIESIATKVVKKMPGSRKS